MIKFIILPIYFNNDKTSNLSKCGIDYNLDECDIRYIKFTDIKGISEDGKYTSIFANGMEFTCSLPINEVEKIMNESINGSISYNLYIKNNKGEFINLT